MNENVRDQIDIIIRATGATAVSYDLLGVTLQLPNATTLFIDYTAGRAIDMLHYEVERAILKRAREEALAAKALSP